MGEGAVVVGPFPAPMPPPRWGVWKVWEPGWKRESLSPCASPNLSFPSRSMGVNVAFLWARELSVLKARHLSRR